MAVTAGNVLVGHPLATGGLLKAPIGTTLPTDATTALNAAFVAQGYISDNGVIQSINTSTSNIKAWGGDIVRAVQTEHGVTYKFMLIETSTATLATYYGSANVSGGNVTLKSGDADYNEWVIEVRDGVKKVRVAIPNGQVTDRSDVVFQDDQAIGYEVVLTAFPDASGVKAYIYTA